jgi:hypothetical protein
MQDKLLKSLAALGHNEESDRLASRDERLLYGVAAGNEFLVLTEKPCRWRVELPSPGGRHGDGRPRRWALIAAGAGSVVRPGWPRHEWRPWGNGLASVNWLGTGNGLGIRGPLSFACELDAVGRIEIDGLGRIDVPVDTDRLFSALY